MLQHIRAWVQGMTISRIPAALSIAVGGLVVGAGIIAGPVGGPFAFGAPDANKSFAGGERFVANPNPIQVCADDVTVSTTLSWQLNRAVRYEIRPGNDTAPAIKTGTGSGKLFLEDVTEDQYYLVTLRTEIYRQAGKVKTRVVRDALIPLTIAYTTEGCEDEPEVTPTPTPTPVVTPTPTPTVVVTPTPTPTPIVRVTPTPTPVVPTPTPFQNQNPYGYVDVVTCDSIAGWSFDPDKPQDSLVVKIYNGSTLLSSQTASQARPDVVQRYGVSNSAGIFGFEYTVPASLKNGAAWYPSVKVVDANTGQEVAVTASHSGSLVCQPTISTQVTFDIPSTVDVCPGLDELRGEKLVKLGVTTKTPILTKISDTQGNYSNNPFIFIPNVYSLSQGETKAMDFLVKLGAGNASSTYTMVAEQNGTVIASQNFEVRRMSGDCDPREYNLSLSNPGDVLCPTLNKYPIISVGGYIYKASDSMGVTSQDRAVARYFDAIQQRWYDIGTYQITKIPDQPHAYVFRQPQNGWFTGVRNPGYAEMTVYFQGRVQYRTYPVGWALPAGSSWSSAQLCIP